MKFGRLFFFLLFLGAITLLHPSPSYAQEEESPHAALVAEIPNLINFAEQANTTFVGDVEGSYAYIAFVIRDNLAVIYVCDGVGVSEWINVEIVDGMISASTESGIVIEATVADDAVNGTVTLPVDDDGTETASHEFTTAPAVPGITGLARYVDEGSVGGWIVTEDGIRGFRKRKHENQCNHWKGEWDRAVQRYMSYPDGSPEQAYWVIYGMEIAQLMIENGCGSPVTY